MKKDMKKGKNEKSYGEDKTKPKSTIEEVINNCVRDGVTDIITEKGVVPTEQMCNADCQLKDPKGICPIDIVLELKKIGALWGEMELLQWLSTDAIKCPTADLMIRDFIDENTYKGKELGNHQFVYALFILAYGASLNAVKDWLSEAVKNGNEDAKDLLRKLK